MQLTPLRTSHSYSMCGLSSAREPGQLKLSIPPIIDAISRSPIAHPHHHPLWHPATRSDLSHPIMWKWMCLWLYSFANAEQLLCAHVFDTSSAVSSSNHVFLAVQNSSISDLVPCLVCLSDRTNNQSLHKPTEWSHTLVTFRTFDQSDEETWPDQKRSTYLHTYISIREHPKGAIIGTCDIWDTDYNTNNWVPGFMKIFITWQLIVTLDSIRNSCDVFRIYGPSMHAAQWRFLK